MNGKRYPSLGRAILMSLLLAVSVVMVGCANNGNSTMPPTALEPDGDVVEPNSNGISEERQITDDEAEALAYDLIATGYSDEEVQSMHESGQINDITWEIWLLLKDHNPLVGQREYDVPNDPLNDTGIMSDTTGNSISGLIIWEHKHPGAGDNPVYDVIYSLNPETGETTIVSSFTHKVQPDGYGYVDATRGLATAYIYGDGYYRFSEDFSKLAVDKTFSDHNIHAGWIGANGEFFDVTEALDLHTKSDFDAPVKFYSAGFSNGYFCYFDATTDEYHYVPVNDVAPSAVRSGKPPKFDNIIEGREFGHGDITSWIDDMHCLVNHFYTASGKGHWVDSVIFDTENQTMAKYVPGDSRLSWNGIVSPDGSQIAFMSSPPSASGTYLSDIYISPVAGGEPIKVGNCSLQLGTYLGGPCQLIGWR